MNDSHSNRIRPPVLIFAGVSFLVILLLVGNSLLNNSNKKIESKLTNTLKKQSGADQKRAETNDHFKINTESDADTIKSKSENYYTAMPSLTGLSSGETLGLDLIEVTVFKNKDDYVKETGKPAWSEGFADYKHKEIYITQSEGLLVSILPHEISHLFFDSYMDYENNEINWLDEGLATLVQVQYDKEQSTSFKNAMIDIRSGKAIAFDNMKNFLLTEKTSNEQINLYYAQTLSLVDYLKRNDLKKWQSLLKKLKSGKSFNQSLLESHKITSTNLQNDWLDFIKANKQSWE